MFSFSSGGGGLKGRSTDEKIMAFTITKRIIAPNFFPKPRKASWEDCLRTEKKKLHFLHFLHPSTTATATAILQGIMTKKSGASCDYPGAGGARSAS